MKLGIGLIIGGVFLIVYGLLNWNMATGIPEGQQLVRIMTGVGAQIGIGAVLFIVGIVRVVIKKM